MNRDDIINECIKQLADDDINSGCDMLVELAKMFAKIGASQKHFEDTRKHIIESAALLTDDHFIREKIKLGERKLYEQRSGKAKTNTQYNIKH